MIIRGIHYYKNGTIRILGIAPKGYSPGDLPLRGEIKKLSKKSLQRLALVVCETDVKFKTMVTLTYPKEFGLNGKRVKRDLYLYLKFLNKCYPMLGYLWFIEFQGRGAPHYHILIDTEVSGIERATLAIYWSDIVGKDKEKVFYVHNRQEACGAIRKKDGARRYALKYALKQNQKKVPDRYTDVGRFWGCNKKVLEYIPKPDYIRLSEEELRKFLVGSGQYATDFKNWPIVLFARTNVSRETIEQNMDGNLTK